MRSSSVITAAACLVLAAASVAAGQSALSKTAKLRNPAALNEKAPATYKAKFDTSKGVFVIEVHRDWAPLAADRFYNLVKNGFYDDARFFRVIPGFMVQFGMNANPAITRVWDATKMKDEPTKQGNKPGYVTFARTSEPDSRGTQVFINYGNNSRLDSQGFAAFGQVVQGMDVVEKLNAQYREQPNQNEIRTKGNAYLNQQFPKLDYIKTATIE
jgi:peptidyl-prolyl cis-trans isomerase A (cyclophilin A)